MDLGRQLQDGEITPLDLLNPENPNPFTTMIETVFSAFPEGSMFNSITEPGVVNVFTPQEKARFVITALVGALENLQMVAKNQESFKTENALFENTENLFNEITLLSGNLECTISALKNLIKEIK